MTNADEFISIIEHAIADAPGVLDDLKHQRARLDADIKRIERLINAMSEPKVKRPKTTKKRNRPKGASLKRAESDAVRQRTRDVAVAILSYPDEEFTAREIWAAIARDDISYGMVAQAFRRMRTTQFIGKMGVVAGQSMWKIMDAAVAEQYTMIGEA